MDPGALLLLLGAGCLAGFLAGVFGRGGEVILVPLLLYYFRTTGVSSLVAAHLALGTSLLVVLCTSAASSVSLARHGQIIVRAAAIAALAAAVGSFGGSLVVGGLQGREVLKIVAVVLFASAIRLLTLERKQKTDAEGPLSVPTLVLGGLCVGGVTSLGGVAGMLAAVPLFYVILHVPLQKATGTSSVIVLIASCVGTASYLSTGWGNEFLPNGTLGFVDWIHALPVIAGMIPMSLVGASVGSAWRTRGARILYGILLLVVATRLFTL